MKLELTLTNVENLGDMNVISVGEIVTALIQSGGLTGVKGGKTIIHFDASGNFMGVQLDYWPWRRRKSTGDTI